MFSSDRKLLILDANTTTENNIVLSLNEAKKVLLKVEKLLNTSSSELGMNVAGVAISSSPQPTAARSD